ncbi:DUF1878 family protein [Virgibacillus soli]|uniref:DUF1878 family protein n=1 Tax=Paracerasibacillus soli TaxID=480284 RepID=A0ABU5CQS4_9BACI|nr:DUF1878 family protein [Virgibacillus soli]MDY0407815.1 DUF1878 family protein [Virgibacillus soli]
MERVSENETTVFHLHLLANVIDMEAYPFIRMVIQANLSKNEYDELMHLLAILNEKYQLQKDEGLLDFSSLLMLLAEKLSEKLQPNELVFALHKEGYYPELMEEFIGIMQFTGQDQALSRNKKRR